MVFIRWSICDHFRCLHLEIYLLCFWRRYHRSVVSQISTKWCSHTFCKIYSPHC